MTATIPLFPPLTGGPEILVILLIAVLLFGANKIPKLARSTGQAMGEFQKGRQEIEDELQQMKEGPSTETGGTSGSSVATEETAAETSSETVSESSAEAESSTESSN